METAMKKEELGFTKARVGLYLIVLKGVFRMGRTNKKSGGEGRVINNYSARPFLVCWAIMACVIYTLVSMTKGSVSSMSFVLVLILSGFLAMTLGISVPVNIKKDKL